MPALVLPPRRLLLRAGAFAVAAWVAALVVLVPLSALLLGDAGDSWDTTSARAGVVVLLAAFSALACGVAGAVGTWRAAVDGAQSRREALAAGCLVPVSLAVLLSLGLMDPSLGGLLAALFSAAASGFGALVGGAMIARRLEG